jgi:hypothetical protein
MNISENSNCSNILVLKKLYNELNYSHIEFYLRIPIIFKHEITITYTRKASLKT